MTDQRLGRLLRAGCLLICLIVAFLVGSVAVTAFLDAL